MSVFPKFSSQEPRMRRGAVFIALLAIGLGMAHAAQMPTIPVNNNYEAASNADDLITKVAHLNDPPHHPVTRQRDGGLCHTERRSPRMPSGPASPILALSTHDPILHKATPSPHASPLCPPSPCPPVPPSPSSPSLNPPHLALPQALEHGTLSAAQAKAILAAAKAAAAADSSKVGAAKKIVEAAKEAEGEVTTDAPPLPCTPTR